jgi:hypothetical protein
MTEMDTAINKKYPTGSERILLVDDESRLCVWNG